MWPLKAIPRKEGGKFRGVAAFGVTRSPKCEIPSRDDEGIDAFLSPRGFAQMMGSFLAGAATGAAIFLSR